MDENTTRFATAPGWRRRWVESWAALGHDVIGAWRYALARDASEPTDDATLRDLGLHRSELASYHAELDGRAPLTRRRAIALRDGAL